MNKKWPNSQTQIQDLMYRCPKSAFIILQPQNFLNKFKNLSKNFALSSSSPVCCYIPALSVRIFKVGACPTCGSGSLSHDEAAAFWAPGQYNCVWFAPSLPLCLSLSRSWQIVGGVNGKAPAPVPLVHHTNVKGTIHVTAWCCHDQSNLS